MSLLDAPAYNANREKLKKQGVIGLAVLFFLTLLAGLAGGIAGHGWFFTNLYAEHRVNEFFTSIQKQDFVSAYGIYQNDAEWQKHPEKYTDYPLKRFTEDWTQYTDAGVIHSHHVDKSVTDGSGPFGTGIIVAVTANGSKRLFIYYIRKDGTLTYPAPHVFEY